MLGPAAGGAEIGLRAAGPNQRAQKVTRSVMLRVVSGGCA